MAGSLPLVRGAVQALYPVTRRVEFLTDIAVHLNGTEQRFKRRPPLTRFVLPYTRINFADTLAIQTFFEAQRGTAFSDWSFTLGSTTYNGLTFEDDTFTKREDAGMQTTYSFTLRARQTQNPGVIAGDAGAAFPKLSSGLRAMLPYTQTRRFAVLLNDNPLGPRYSWAFYGGGLGPSLVQPNIAPFPTGALHAWELNYPVITDADLATIETHFRNQWGAWGLFSLTDPDDGTVYPRCRYDMDQLVVSHNGPNQSSVTLRIQETF